MSTVVLFAVATALLFVAVANPRRAESWSVVTYLCGIAVLLVALEVIR